MLEIANGFSPSHGGGFPRTIVSRQNRLGNDAMAFSLYDATVANYLQILGATEAL